MSQLMNAIYYRNISHPSMTSIITTIDISAFWPSGNKDKILSDEIGLQLWSIANWPVLEENRHKFH
jgi:hypothetical protein